MGNGKNPLVSIVALFYNQQGYVKDTVEALFAQTYENCEIILSDDCSSDGTADVLRKLASEYNGVHKVIVNVNKKNLGIGNNFKNAMAMSHGEWIVTCGGDDVFERERVRHIVEYANRNVCTT